MLDEIFIKRMADLIAERVIEKIGKPDVSPLMTPTEAAAYLKKPSRQAIYHMVHDGELTPTRHGAKTYFKKTELDRWIGDNSYKN